MDPSVHWVAGAVLLSRIGDVVSTRLVSPTLALEANPLARRLGWPFAWATLLVCVVPYFNAALGVVLAVPSFFITGSNLSRAWVVRALGEHEYMSILHRAARRSTLPAMTGFVIASACAFGIPGALLCLFAEDPPASLFGAGVLAYAGAVGIHGVANVRRVWRSARIESPTDALASHARSSRDGSP